MRDSPVSPEFIFISPHRDAGNDTHGRITTLDSIWTPAEENAVLGDERWSLYSGRAALGVSPQKRHSIGSLNVQIWDYPIFLYDQFRISKGKVQCIIGVTHCFNLRIASLLVLLHSLYSFTPCIASLLVLLTPCIASLFTPLGGPNQRLSHELSPHHMMVHIYTPLKNSQLIFFNLSDIPSTFLWWLKPLFQGWPLKVNGVVWSLPLFISNRLVSPLRSTLIP